MIKINQPKNKKSIPINLKKPERTHTPTNKQNLPHQFTQQTFSYSSPNHLDNKIKSSLSQKQETNNFYKSPSCSILKFFPKKNTDSRNKKLLRTSQLIHTLQQSPIQKMDRRYSKNQEYLSFNSIISETTLNESRIDYESNIGSGKKYQKLDLFKKRLDNIFNSRTQKQLDVQMLYQINKESVFLQKYACINHPQKKAKYMSKSTSKKQYDHYYCSKCAIKLVSQNKFRIKQNNTNNSLKQSFIKEKIKQLKIKIHQQKDIIRQIKNKFQTFYNRQINQHDEYFNKIINQIEKYKTDTKKFLIRNYQEGLNQFLNSTNQLQMIQNKLSNNINKCQQYNYQINSFTQQIKHLPLNYIKMDQTIPKKTQQLLTIIKQYIYSTINKSYVNFSFEAINNSKKQNNQQSNILYQKNIQQGCIIKNQFEEDQFQNKKDTGYYSPSFKNI